MSHEKYEARARVAKALAHPTRLLLLDLLQASEQSVNALTEAAAVDQSTVSKHLAVLREAGLVAARREGASHYYRVTCGCLDSFFACLEAAVIADVERRQAACTAAPVRTNEPPGGTV